MYSTEIVLAVLLPPVNPKKGLFYSSFTLLFKPNPKMLGQLFVGHIVCKVGVFLLYGRDSISPRLARLNL